MSDNLTYDSEGFSDLEKDILGVLGPQRDSEGELNFPEKSVSEIAEILDKTRPYLSNVLNDMLSEELVERRKEGNKHLYKINEEENLGLNAYIQSQNRKDIQMLKDSLLEDLSIESLLNSSSPFNQTQVNIYAEDVPEPEKALLSTKVDEKRLKELVSEGRTEIRELILLINEALRKNFENKWEKKMREKFDEIASDTLDEESQEIAQEYKKNILDIIWRNQDFVANFNHFAEEFNFGGNEYDSAWDLFAGLSNPDVYKEVSKIDKPEDFIDRLAKEMAETREYAMVISERKRN